MAKWLNTLCGLILPDTQARVDVAPPSAPARIIFGGSAAPELCMLPAEWEEAWRTRWMADASTERRVAQVKVDGINAVYLDGRVVGGRQGGPLDCALHCQPGLTRLEEHIGHPMVFFGEYSAHDGFNATIGEHKSGKGSGVFWLYDAIPHGAWVTGQDYLVPIEQRLEALRQAFNAADTGMFVGMLDWWVLNGPETRAKARELWAAGYEGLVSKEAGSGYARRRDDRWLKVKDRHRVACAVQDVLYHDGRPGSVVLRAPAAAGVKPITITGGWTAEEGEAIDLAVRRHHPDRLAAWIEFELTVGSPRSIRGAAWRQLLVDGREIIS